MELRGGGAVEMWSLDSPDSGRGRATAVAVVDECALVRDLENRLRHTIDHDRFQKNERTKR